MLTPLAAWRPHGKMHLLLTFLLASILNLALVSARPMTPGAPVDLRNYQYPSGYNPSSPEWQHKYNPQWLETMNQPSLPYIVTEPLAYLRPGDDPLTGQPQMITLAVEVLRLLIKKKNEEIAKNRYYNEFMDGVKAFLRIQEIANDPECHQEGVVCKWEEIEDEVEGDPGKEDSGQEPVDESKSKSPYGVWKVDENGFW